MTPPRDTAKPWRHAIAARCGVTRLRRAVAHPPLKPCRFHVDATPLREAIAPPSPQAAQVSPDHLQPRHAPPPCEKAPPNTT
jgi:hypothetical protein